MQRVIDGFPARRARRALLAFVVACAFAPTLAAAQDKAAYNQRAAARYAALFQALDRDGDGTVTREEAHADLNFVPYFDDMDINRDGSVTGAELSRFVQQQYGIVLEPQRR